MAGAAVGQAEQPLGAGGNSGEVALNVRDGLADAGTARIGALECMRPDGRIALAEFKALSVRTGDGFLSA